MTDAKGAQPEQLVEEVRRLADESMSEAFLAGASTTAQEVIAHQEAAKAAMDFLLARVFSAEATVGKVRRFCDSARAGQRIAVSVDALLEALAAQPPSEAVKARAGSNAGVRTAEPAPDRDRPLPEHSPPSEASERSGT